MGKKQGEKVSFAVGQKRGEELGDARNAILQVLYYQQLCRRLENNPSLEEIEDVRTSLMLFMKAGVHYFKKNPELIQATRSGGDPDVPAEWLARAEAYLQQESFDVVYEDAFPGVKTTPRTVVIKRRLEQANEVPEEAEKLSDE